MTFSVENGQGAVAGFGLFFLDADYPKHSASGLSVYDIRGQLLAVEQGFRSRSGGKIFRGIVTIDKRGKLMPVISRARVINGGEWPWVSTKSRDGVVLDDFVFSEPSADSLHVGTPVDRERRRARQSF